MSTTEPTGQDHVPLFPRHPDRDDRPALTTARVIGITIAVICAVLGLLAVAFVVVFLVALNSWGSNK